MFQYPLRVEMDWNQARHLSLDTEPHRFSTLCGSKWIGTCRRSDHLLPFQQVSVPSAGRNGLELNRFATSLCNLSGFQYPLRVEMDWNAPGLVWAIRFNRVSVPSAGRNGLEQ